MTESIVSRKKKRAQVERMARLGIRDQDLRERFILGSGRGGQKLNKTSSCVQLRHVPSGIEVKCQCSRSREMNRFMARRFLSDRLEEKILEEQSALRQKAEKIRRQKRRRSRRQKQLMLEEKHRQSERKQLRQSIAELED